MGDYAGLTIMKSITKQRIQEIKTKVKSLISGTPEFKHADDVIDLSIDVLYAQLKQQKIIK